MCFDLNQPSCYLFSISTHLPSPSGTLTIQKIRPLDVPTLPSSLSLLNLCYILDSLYCFVFKFTSLFFFNFKSVLNPTHCIFRFISIFFIFRGFIWVFLYFSFSPYHIHIFFYLLEYMDHICNTCFNTITSCFIVSIVFRSVSID